MKLGLEAGLPEASSVGDGRVIESRNGHVLGVLHGRRRDDLGRRHLLHRLKRLLLLGLVEIGGGTAVARNLQHDQFRKCKTRFLGQIL